MDYIILEITELIDLAIAELINPDVKEFVY